MARHDSPPDSPLSSMGSGDSYEEDATEPADNLPPAKRQKTNDGGSAASPAVATHPEGDLDPLDDMSDVSSDTSGDVPSSPIHARLDEDEFQEQVTVCVWEGCKAGDQGDMDKLVDHIHNDHIENRQKKYTCEWRGCGRQGLPHASGYALKAHMRSHTREKPFYCYLPECDRAFTRSDALAKHMRTVHETEALRPSDPVPKSMQSGGASASGPLTGKSGSRLKIILKTPSSHTAGHDSADDAANGDDAGADPFTPLTEELGFTPKELAMQLKPLHALCRLQVRWAEADGEALRRECRRWEELYKQEWLEKEVLLDQVVQSEIGWCKRRRAVLSGAVDLQPPPDAKTNGVGTPNGDGHGATNGDMEVDAD